MTMMPHHCPPGGEPSASGSGPMGRTQERIACGCRIQPAWDGSGDYVVWIWYRTSGTTSWQILSRHDGTPQRFLNAELAGVYARQCGFRPEAVSVRWPPHETTPAADKVTGIAGPSGR
ncbi:hypothetical protein [Arhodomonas sp. AD133]|uniref:hypothetical protein n=1 Tax=Arhodomonas sp. AD133 TaxID=3415009 RepID=UPI003EB80CA7